MNLCRVSTVETSQQRWVLAKARRVICKWLLHSASRQGEERVQLLEMSGNEVASKSNSLKSVRPKSFFFILGLQVMTITFEGKKKTLFCHIQPEGRAKTKPYR